MTATPVAVNGVTRTGIVNNAGQACDAVNGNIVAVNGGTVWLEFQNTDTNPHTVTMSRPGSTDGVANPGFPVTIAAGVTRKHGGWPVPLYGNSLTFTADSNLVKVAAYTLL